MLGNWEILMLCCKKCGGDNYVKAGVVKGEQRYKCKDCGCQFVPTRQRGKTEKESMTAVWLYCHGLSLRAIAKFFKVTASAVLKWVRSYARNNYEKPVPKSDAVVVELDEMWHFLFSKKQNLDLESLLSRYPSTYRLGMWRAGY
jgi:transposase